MSLSHLPLELLGPILINIFPDEWDYYFRWYEVLNLRTVCRKYVKRIFLKFPLNNEVSGDFNQEILALLPKRDKIGWELLHWAAFCGHEAVVKLLLEKGANVEYKSGNGCTALWWAAEKGHEAVVKLLLEKGADVEPKN